MSVIFNKKKDNGLSSGIRGCIIIKALVNNRFLLFFLLISLLKPAAFDYIPMLDWFFNFLRIISAVTIIILYLLSPQKSMFMLFVFMYQFSLLYSTVLNQGDYWKLFINCGAMASICMLTELFMKANCKHFFSVLYKVLFLLVTVNFVFVLVMPDGIFMDDYYNNQYNFLGIDNSLFPIMLLAMTINIIHAYINSQNTSLILFIIVTATVFITWSATGVLAYSVFMIYLLMFYKKQLERLCTFTNCILLFIVLFLVIIIFRYQEMFSFIIEDILGKSITFTRRTEIWDIAFQMIKIKPVVGYGVYSEHGLINWYGIFMYAHNGILEILLQGGFVSLTCFSCLLFAAGRSLSKENKSISHLIMAAIFCILLTMLTEAYITSIYVYLLLAIASQSEAIVSSEKSLTTGKNDELKVIGSRYIKGKQVYNLRTSISDIYLKH